MSAPRFIVESVGGRDQRGAAAHGLDRGMMSQMTSPQRMPQMDGLRAIAVFAVLYQHWFEPRLPVGSWGVILFFVISGYLITRSLNSLKDRGLSTSQSAWAFFSRRALRLFPAYYALLMVAGATEWSVRHAWPWYAFYLSNVRLAIEGHWVSLTPTWSLAVEEQFYIGWFFAVIMLSSRGLAIASGVLIAAAIMFRAVIFPNAMGNFLLPACFDALALGSLLCVVRKPAPSWTVPACLALVIGAVAMTLQLSDKDFWVISYCPMLVAMAATLAVWKARNGFSGPAGIALSWKPVTYLGRISYGIYLYDMLTPIVLTRVPFLRAVGDGNFAFHVGVTVAISIASYHLLEQPILNLRRPVANR